MDLIRNRDLQLHARVDRADHRGVAGLLEGDVGRGAGRLRTEIELVALAGGNDVVRDAVVVDEGQRFALLEGHVIGGKYPALLRDGLGGGQGGSDGQAEDNCNGEQRNAAHRKTSCWLKVQRGMTGTAVGSS